MSDHVFITIVQYLVLGAYKIATIAAGAASLWFGYRLFVIGTFEKAGDLQAVWGDKRLLLKQAAPGTFFAMLGASILILVVWKGVYFEQQTFSSVGNISSTGNDGTLISGEDGYATTGELVDKRMDRANWPLNDTARNGDLASTLKTMESGRQNQQGGGGAAASGGMGGSGRSSASLMRIETSVHDQEY